MQVPETINKEKIAEMLKCKLGLSGILCEELVNRIFASIYEITSADTKLMLKNFGTFSINHKKARIGQNLQTKEKVNISSRTVFRFLAAEQLKNAVNRK